ncbi:MAG: HNH endonuclease signature motif containing protein [Smithellaceae bacterium]
MKSTKDIPARTKKLIIQEAAGVCSFCCEKDVSTLEFHHIHGKDIPDPHAPENLIYVCKNCHGKITAGQISEIEVKLKKRFLKFSENRNKNAVGISNVINFSGKINAGTIANVVHYHGRAPGKTINKPPQGTIGAEVLKRNYLKHLIDRYHDFAKAEKGQSYKYPVFYQAINRRYGAKWDMIPLQQFEDCCVYVQYRIDNTVLGKNKKAKGQSNYSSFSEYCAKYVNGGDK